MRLGQPIARYYNEFEARGNQLLFDGIEITKRHGELRSVAEIRRRLGTYRLRAMRFTDYTTPNKGSKVMAQELLNEIVHVDRLAAQQEQEKADDIEMMPLLENVLDETESLIEETPFVASFTERERRGLNLELQTLKGNLKHLKNKMIFYDSEITKAEAKVKRLETKKATPGVSEEQQTIWNKDIARAREDLEQLQDQKEAVREAHGKFLKYLAGKAGKALPGIVGTVVSFFFRVAAKVVEYAAKHLYMAIAAAAAFVVAYVGKIGKKS